jgi:hypothetical protein
MLSDSHPAYLTQLRIRVAKTHEYADKAILTLTLISMGILCAQVPIGMLPAVLWRRVYLVLFHRIIFTKRQASKE